MYNLDASTREKPVMNVDDIYLILHDHWVVDTAIFPDGRQRVQIALRTHLACQNACEMHAQSIEKFIASLIDLPAW
jgi:hypothetical protein